MEMKNVLYAIGFVFLTFLLIVSGIVMFCFFRTKSYDNDFEKLKISTPIEIVKNEWGKPDEIFTYQDTLIVLTYNDGIITDYVFKFDRQSKKLVEKWAGD